ncbi:MAG: diaminopimelate epimerase [Candidatus Pelagibacter sp.]
MDIKAFKMDGLGNDFVIIDNRHKTTDLTKQQIIKICDRKFIGCDQLILINKNDTSDASLEFYNSDGGTSGACGNGTRCVADLLSKENNKSLIILTTQSGDLKSEILGDRLVSTEIGKGKTEWNEIPLSKKLDTNNLNIKISDLDNNNYTGGAAVNVGNPHVIFFVDNNENFEIQKIGPVIEHHSLFPEKCNVTLATIVNKELIKVKVWERGAGLTKACGTAACATAFAAMKNGLSSNKVDIEFSTGKLSIFIDENNSIHMKGPVSDIKEINIKI